MSGFPIRSARSAAAIAAAAVAGWLVSTAFPLAASSEDARPIRHPVAVTGEGYAGSARCSACHPHHVDTWRASYHRTMTQVVTPETVVADFDARLRDGDLRYRFDRLGDSFWVEIESASERKPRRRQRIVLSTGSHHMQLYWLETGESRKLDMLPFVYDLREQRWIPRRSAFLTPPREPFQSERGQWNVNCIDCHTTDGRPRMGPGGEMKTEVSEFGISCEACHGPAEAHVAANRDPVHRYDGHLGETADPTIVHPARLSAERSAEVCGRCHSINMNVDKAGYARWLQDGDSFRPGMPLAEVRVVAGPDRDLSAQAEALKGSPSFFEDRFWSDGMVRVAGREYNGLIRSPCAKGGEFSCLSCHQLHQSADDPREISEWADDQLAMDRDGDAACTGCHSGIAASLAEHTHHEAESAGSRCQNCHMPHTTYGLLKAIRSHEIDVPTVQASLETGRPNACNQCHLDKSLGWTAGHLADWYDTPAPALSAEQREVAASLHWLLRGDAGQRALAAWTLGWREAHAASGDEWIAPFLAEALVDPYDAVRYITYASLRTLPGYADFDYDFTARGKARAMARQRALERWDEGGSGRVRRDDPMILLDADGRVRAAAVGRLLSERDDRRVTLFE
jgi:hypothetical protein